jgi:hypothetical protein
VKPEDLRQFARRDWAKAADGKRDYWTEQYLQHGSAPARSAATALLIHMRAVQPGYPSPSDRDEDLATHRSLRRRLDRAAHAFTRR